MRRRREKGSTTYPPPYFPLQRLSLPPIETKPQVLPYFPSVFPLLSCKSFLRECSPVTHSTLAPHNSSLSATRLPPPMFTLEQPIRVLYSQWISHSSCARAARRLRYAEITSRPYTKRRERVTHLRFHSGDASFVRPDNQGRGKI